jgi:hypothetical protein
MLKLDISQLRALNLYRAGVFAQKAKPVPRKRKPNFFFAKAFVKRMCLFFLFAKAFAQFAKAYTRNGSSLAKRIWSPALFAGPVTSFARTFLFLA